MCPDCQNTGYITTFTTRKRCARCLAAKADELINMVMAGKRQLREWSPLRPGVSIAEVIRQLDAVPTWDEAGNLIKGDPDAYFGGSGFIVPPIYP